MTIAIVPGELGWRREKRQLVELERPVLELVHLALVEPGRAAERVERRGGRPCECAASSSRIPAVARPAPRAHSRGPARAPPAPRMSIAVDLEPRNTAVRRPIRSMWSGVLRIAAIASTSARSASARWPRSSTSTCRRSPRRAVRGAARGRPRPQRTGTDGLRSSITHRCTAASRAARGTRAPRHELERQPVDSARGCRPRSRGRGGPAPPRARPRVRPPASTSSNPGRRYGTTAMSSPSASCTAASGSGAFASAQIASAWMWSTWGAGGRRAAASRSRAEASRVDQAAREVGDHLLVAHRLALAQREQLVEAQAREVVRLDRARGRSRCP